MEDVGEAESWLRSQAVVKDGYEKFLEQFKFRCYKEVRDAYTCTLSKKKKFGNDENVEKVLLNFTFCQVIRDE
jgi:hypothetical protein